jgi:hypothetical protein
MVCPTGQKRGGLVQAPRSRYHEFIGRRDAMKQLIEDIAKALVDIPEEVSVKVVEGEQVTVWS